MALDKEAIWEQASPKDAELRIQQAFEMLLGEEFGLACNSAAIDLYYPEGYNQDRKPPTR